MAKRAEETFRDMVKRRGYFWHKYGDVRTCWKCHAELPKTENAPDFAVAVVYTYVEAKNSGKDGTWRWAEVSATGRRRNQREWLRVNHGWLFIELGNRRVSSNREKSGKSAYLVPFDLWLTDIEPDLIRRGVQSIRRETLYPNTKRERPGADVYLAAFRLDWDKGEWVIPTNHIWWRRLRVRLQRSLATTAERCYARKRYPRKFQRCRSQSYDSRDRLG